MWKTRLVCTFAALLIGCPEPTQDDVVFSEADERITRVHARIAREATERGEALLHLLRLSSPHGSRELKDATRYLLARACEDEEPSVRQAVLGVEPGQLFTGEQLYAASWAGCGVLITYGEPGVKHAASSLPSKPQR